MKKIIVSLAALFFLVTASSVFAYVAASANFKLEKDSLNFGGTESAASSNFINNGTVGEIISGLSGGTNYNASSGYRYMNLDLGNVSTVVRGCTDPEANNYNALATQDDGTCTYDSGGSIVYGCTNSSALNYNSLATVDNDTCIYGVPNVTDFEAQYNDSEKAIHLTWKNPVGYNLKAVMIVRGKGVIPLNPNDGLLVYNGSGESTWDRNIEPGVLYYYTAFVKSQDDRYSSGVVTSERVPDPNAIRGCTNPLASNYNPSATVDDGNCLGEGGISGCTDPQALNYNPVATSDNGNCNYSPFSSTSTPEEIITTGSSDWDFRFIQPEERVKTFDEKMRVRVLGQKDLTILFNYNLAPATLKTIGVTLTDPIDSTKTFSFLMHQNSDGSAYEATISPLIRKGTYPVDIYIINYGDRAVKHIKGRLIVSGVGIFSMTILEEQAVPIAVSTGLAIGFLPSFYNLLIILYRIFSYFFGRRREDNPWGTVYDSVTKRPLDPVYLTVEQEGKEITTAITDIDGRFSFFLPAGIFSIKAGKTHYRFPSERLAGKKADELYNNLYFGDKFTTNGEAVINLNVPMDPIDFDWNEFAKTKTNFFQFYEKRRLWLNRLYKFVFISGFLLSIYSFLLSPSWWNIVILILYLGLFAVNRFWQGYNKPLQIIKKSTGEPLSFAILRVFLPDLNQQIKYVVADKLGRFYLLVRPGVYYYTIEEKQLDGSYLKIFQSNSLNLPKGVLAENIYI